MLTRIRRFAYEERVIMLKVQPPADREDVPALLRERGFARSHLNTAPAASVRVVLRPARDEGQLLKAMRATTRRHVRTAIKRGVTVQSGDADDLGVFQAMIEATAARQGFAPYPQTYYRRLWRAFGEDGHARLLIARYQRAPVAAAMLIAFGDTVLYKMGGWGGAPAPGANELMHYTGMCWAQQEGFSYYDLEGIPPEIAQTVLSGGKVPASAGLPFFKLGFGGKVVLYPEAHDAYFGPVLGRIARRVLPHAERSGSMVHRIVGRAA
jgi:lipid II:glycine glycyltransferase (peptidoglycan interpeptide bridge formation enzyme)